MKHHPAFRDSAMEAGLTDHVGSIEELLLQGAGSW